MPGEARRWGEARGSGEVQAVGELTRSVSPQGGDQL